MLRYGGSTGAFLNAFTATDSGGLDNPTGLVFGSDSNLYVVSSLTKFLLHGYVRYVGVAVNWLPTVVSSIADQQLEPGGTAFASNLTAIFDDAAGDALAFSALLSNTAVATVGSRAPR